MEQTQYKIIIPGKPIPLARARRGKYGNFYTPAKSLAFQRKIHLFAKLHHLPKLTGAIIISLRFFRTDPCRVDIDNLQKNVFDGLRYFFNDRQIIQIYAEKKKCKKGEERTEIEIYAKT